MPEFRVKNAAYEVMTFGPVQLTAPTVFIFYRGGWSSECQRHLRRLQEAHSMLRQMGFAVVFLSADAPHNLRERADRVSSIRFAVSQPDAGGARVRRGLPRG